MRRSGRNASTHSGDAGRAGQQASNDTGDCHLHSHWTPTCDQLPIYTYTVYTPTIPSPWTAAAIISRTQGTPTRLRTCLGISGKRYFTVAPKPQDGTIRRNTVGNESGARKVETGNCTADPSRCANARCTCNLHDQRFLSLGKYKSSVHAVFSKRSQSDRDEYRTTRTGAPRPGVE